MRLEFFPEETSYIRNIPFKLTLNNTEYRGVLSELYSVIGGMSDLFYEINWEDESPDMDDNRIINLILEHLKQ